MYNGIAVKKDKNVSLSATEVELEVISFSEASSARKTEP